MLPFCPGHQFHQSLFSAAAGPCFQMYVCLTEYLTADVEYTLARSRFKFDEQEAYMATAFSVRDRLIEAWNDTNTYFK